MRQYLFASSGASVLQNVNYLTPLQGDYGFAGAVNGPLQPFPTSGKLSMWTAQCITGVSAGASRAYDFYINGVSQATITLSASEKIAHAEGPWTISAGDTVQYYVTQTNFPGSTELLDCMLFTSDIEDETVILSRAHNASNVANSYHPMMGYNPSSSATEAGAYAIAPTSGTFKKLYILTPTPNTWGIAPDAYRVTLYKNSAPTSLTATVTAPGVSANDTTNTVSVSAGDKLSWYVEPLNGPVTAASIMIGSVFVPSTHGEQIILGSSTSLYSLVNSGTRYWYITGVAPSVGDVNSGGPRSAQASLRKFYVELSASPYVNDLVNDWYSFTIRQGGSDTALTCQIADGGTGNKVGNDTTHEVRVMPGNSLSLKIVPNSSPATVYAGWGVVLNVKDYPGVGPGPPTFSWPL